MALPSPVVAVFGATALGKSDVAAVLAQRLGGDVVVADSMQVYEGLPIVTNQPDDCQRSRARYHLVGIVPPQREFTVAEYARRAHEVIDALRDRGRAVVVEGGSGLYLRAALGDLGFAAPPDAALRSALEGRWARDPAAVIAELRALDPIAAAGLDLRNPRRVIRALEAVRVTGRPLAADERDRLWQPAERYPHRLVALAPAADREALRARIDARVDAMLTAGAMREVERARAAGPFSRTALQAIGMRELCACLDGQITLAQAAERMKARTRALVRRQLTWMRRLPQAAVVDAAGRSPVAVAATVLDILGTAAW